jgi:hypothetical protein
LVLDSAVISLLASPVVAGSYLYPLDALERLPPTSPDHVALAALYDQSTEEVNERARRAWSTAN